MAFGSKAAAIIPSTIFSLAAQRTASAYHALSGTSVNGNSISENIYYHNLMNVSRISFRIKGKKLLTDEEIWAE